MKVKGKGGEIKGGVYNDLNALQRVVNFLYTNSHLMIFSFYPLRKSVLG